nr:FkbM family methyltransferase [uncultured Roseateles sp.]
MSFLDQLVHAPGPQLAALDALKASSRPVVVYGAGVYAYVVIKYLRGLGIAVRACAVDAAYRTTDHAHGLPLLAIEDSGRLLGGSAHVIGITHHEAARHRLARLGIEDALVVDVPDFLNIPQPFMGMNFIEAHQSEFTEAYGTLADDLSRETFVAAINAKINFDVRHLLPVVRPDHLYFWQTEFQPTPDESLLDVGGFDGDSVRDFHRITLGRYRGILSLEPFADSFALLQQAIAEVDAGAGRVRALACGAWDTAASLPMAVRDENIDNRIVETGEHSIEVDTIDRIVARTGFEPTLIKMDINGAESLAVAGARDCLRALRPSLVAKLHVKEDFFRLPRLLKDIHPDVNIRIRQRNYMSMMLVVHASFDR